MEEIGQPVLVEELPSWLDAWEAAGCLADLHWLLFLDSALTESPMGRYSFLTADPFHFLKARGRQVEPAGEPAYQGDPFTRLQADLWRWRTEPIPGLPPFQGGAAGLFGYDLCHHIERLPRPRVDEFGVPDLAVGFYDWVLAFDHDTRRAWFIATGLPGVTAEERAQRASKRWKMVSERLARLWPTWPAHRHWNHVTLEMAYRLARKGKVLSNFTRAGYLETVRRAIEYIHAGDCFQVNLAQRLAGRLNWLPWQLYRRLRECNPAPFAGYFDLGEAVIASASPERFVKVSSGEVETRPIKGTRPRGATREADRALAEELLHSAKDRAENVMIVDLLRNDLGRVCRYGSVRVARVCELESYRTVHHLVSEVRGRLRPGAGPVDLLRAAFPGGSVTGAPKVRAMEIIAELEPTARGPYCGSLGYIGFDGSMDASILIRTMVLSGGWVWFPVGGGIVADSQPEAEYAETLAKAEGLLRALREG